MKKYEYVEVSSNEQGIKHKLQCMIGGNGDYYLSICPKNHNGGPAIRLETSGEASTRNPELLAAVSLLYSAMKEDKKDFWDKVKSMKVINI